MLSWCILVHSSAIWCILVHSEQKTYLKYTLISEIAVHTYVLKSKSVRYFQTKMFALTLGAKSPQL
jgi:hypothetical protein